ncbi:DUF3320 domain-containing protein [Actinomyces bowdenii]|uniref:DUF3320 domain-containing protein n=1 Tax=Actinomyces bowdenii TaxID=131109 RepID=UPI00214C5ED5|nr:DUF3320 domain-containing protein [Actinomyces bowdenii]MCR2052365.1 DUF3320 domain-containing protein [Actinomyces bowdenii]
MSSYRSVFAIHQPPDTIIPRVRADLITGVEESFRDLLGSRGMDAFSPGMKLSVGDGVELIWIDQTLKSDDRLIGFVVIDSRGQGERIEQVMLAGGPRDPGVTIVSVKVGGQAVSNDAPHRTAPQVVNQLLAEFRCEDYGIILTHWPLILRPADIDHLLKELSEIDHHVQVIVAATDENSNVEHVQESLGRLMAPAVGMCAAVVLDPQATRLFNERVSPSHAVTPGMLRLYVPGAQFGDAEDGPAHEEISLAAALADDGSSAAADLYARTAGFAAAQTLARRERRYLSVLGAMLDDAANSNYALQPAETDSKPLPPSSPHEHTPEAAPAGEGLAPPEAPSPGSAPGSAAAQEASELQDHPRSHPQGGGPEHIRVRDELIRAQQQVNELQAQLRDALTRITQLEKERDALRATATSTTARIGASSKTAASGSSRDSGPGSLREELRRSRRECQELHEELNSMRIRALAAEKRNRILAERSSRHVPQRPAHEPDPPHAGGPRPGIGNRVPPRVTGSSRAASPTPSPTPTRTATMSRTPLTPGSTSRSPMQRAGNGGPFFRPSILGSSPGEYREWHSMVTRSSSRLRDAVRGTDSAARAELIAVVQHILAVEAPVHRHRLGNLVRNAYGLASLRESLREALWDTLAATGHMVTDDLDFVWSIADQRLEEPVIVRSARRYALDHVERLDHVHPHELAIILAAVTQDQPWCTEEDLFRAALGRLSRRHRQLSPDNLMALRRAHRLSRPGRARIGAVGCAVDAPAFPGSLSTVSVVGADWTG